MSSLLIDGVKVWLESFKATRTYASVILGVPTEQDNRQIIEEFVRSTRRRHFGVCAIHTSSSWFA